MSVEESIATSNLEGVRAELKYAMIKVEPDSQNHPKQVYAELNLVVLLPGNLIKGRDYSSPGEYGLAPRSVCLG